MPKPKSKNTEVIASPEHDRRQRRRFNPADKERILREADGCTERGQLGELLRREGIYSSQLGDWRAQREREGLSGLSLKRPGPKPRKDDKDRMLEQRDKHIAKLEKELRISKAVIDLQIKAHEILGIALPRIEDPEMEDLQKSSGSARPRSR